MKCLKCGYELKDGEKFCSNCGERSAESCPQCGNLLTEGMKFCVNCGYSLIQEKNQVIRSERTKESFIEELKQLSQRDSISKAVLAMFGTKIFSKYLYPFLLEGEELVTMDFIQSKMLFARHRKEFVALTNQRVIKFEKMRYCKPRIEICFLPELKTVDADEPSNAVTGTFVGEKLTVKCLDREIFMRMVGKGAAKGFKGRILDERERFDTDPNIRKISDSEINQIKKRTEKNNRISGRKIIGFASVAVFIVIAAIILGSGNNTSELSGYLPLARADVMKFIDKHQLKKDETDNIYKNDELAVVLNENGNIDVLLISSADYSLYGLTVGSKFSLEKEGKQLTEHNYGYIADADNTMLYGVMSGSDTPGGDRKIGIVLNKEGIITEILYMASGSQSVIDAISGMDNDELETQKSKNDSSSVLNTESENSNTEALEPLKLENVFNNSVYISDTTGTGMILGNNNNVSFIQFFDQSGILWDGTLAGYAPMEHGGLKISVNGYDYPSAVQSSMEITWNSSEQAAFPEVNARESNGMAYSGQYSFSHTLTEEEKDMNTVSKGDPSDEYILPDSNSRYLDVNELSGMSKEELRLARNEIYARHGRIFGSSDLNDYFNSMAWYVGNVSAEEFDESVLNDYEKSNLDLIKSIEGTK